MEERGGGAQLTFRLDLVPHLLDLSLLDLGRGGVEAADLVPLLVGEDRIWKGLVLGFGHLILGDRGQGR